MTLGKLYGIGVGPGDPDLVTVKGASLLARCRQVFVPKGRAASQSLALNIARRHVSASAQVHELLFPMTTDAAELAGRWAESADRIAEVLQSGEDACFLTLGDPFLYSTYIYLVRAVRERLPGLEIVTVPGITSFSAAAALTEFPVGEGKQPVVIVPTAEDLTEVKRALQGPGTVILMKIGKRLGDILDALEEAGLLDQAVFVAHAGAAEQRIETDLRRLRDAGPEAGYLSIILVRCLRTPPRRKS
ncbi:MAG: precorrin-2 C(20)-methyltransferase [Planctomycetes bacterium]|nr:precorrin-2 C(20)-methyltransferase [Planctomycetota bacterium]